MAFSICAKIKMSHLSVSIALSYLDLFIDNNVSAHMFSNHISATRTMSVLYDLPYQPWDHSKIKYFVKSIKLIRPMALPKRNVINLNTLKTIAAITQRFPNPLVYKAVFLTAFFGFFRLSTISPPMQFQSWITPGISNVFVFISIRIHFSKYSYSYSNTFVKNVKYSYLYSNTFQKYSYS